MAIPDLTVIIVSYNVRDFLEQALTSIRKALRGLNSEICVVDNASVDGSAELVRTHFPDVTLIVNEENLGFARANNLVLKNSEARYFCLINPDTIVQEDTFRTTIDYLNSHDDVGMAGCKILNPDGTLQLACRRSFPTPWIAFSKVVGLSRLFPRSRLFGRYNLTYLDPDQSYPVEAISGSFMVVRREVVEKVGALDEDFFLYGEDLDWCYRIGKAGWKIQYLPATQIIHFKGESSRRSSFDSVRLFYQAMHLFVRKHFSRRYFLLPQWLLLCAIWARAIVSLLGRIYLVLRIPMLDLVLMFAALVLAVFIRFGNLNYIFSFLYVNIFYTAIWIICLVAIGCYGDRRYSSSRAGTAILLGFIINSALTFFFKQYGFSRAVVLYSGCINLMTIAGWRIVARVLPRLGMGPFKGTLGRTLLRRRTLIVGDCASAAKLLSRLRSQVEGGYEVIGVLNLEDTGSATEIEGVPIFYSPDQINSIVITQKVQEVIFSTDQIAYDRILRLISRVKKRGTNFKLIPSNLDVIIGKASVDHIDDIPLIDVDYKLHNLWYAAIKRALDIAIATGALLMMSPILLYAIVIEKHTVRRRQIAGRFSRVVEMWELQSAHGWRMRLPGLCSVIKGDLSLVGGEIRDAGSNADSPLELELKPGLTGMGQLRSTRNLSQEDKEKQTLYYLKNYSPLLDLEILFKSMLKL